MLAESLTTHTPDVLDEVAAVPKGDRMQSPSRMSRTSHGPGMSHAAERRGRGRGRDGEPERRSIVSMIVSTYRELPGLTLHVNQAARLFGLRTVTCQVVLEDLVRGGQLRRTTDGQFTVR